MDLKSKASQDFVPIKDIRDGIAILESGGLRGVLMASSVNFSLKSADERKAIILQFQNFLNTVDFSIQIFIQSRELDIRPYLALLEEQKKGEVNELMKIQTTQYIEFIKDFTQNTNIMTKNFFIVVPYSPANLQASDAKGFVGGILKSKKKEDKSKKEELNFERNRTQLEQRMAVVEQGLSRTGIRVVKLGTDEVTELFYKIFNPGEGNQPANQQK